MTIWFTEYGLCLVLFICKKDRINFRLCINFLVQIIKKIKYLSLMIFLRFVTKMNFYKYHPHFILFIRRFIRNYFKRVVPRKLDLHIMEYVWNYLEWIAKVKTISREIQMKFIFKKLFRSLLQIKYQFILTQSIFP